MSRLPTLSKRVVSGKRVLVRIDSDVDISGNSILDDTRLLSSLDTLRFLLKQKCAITLVGHRGRPDGVERKYSLQPIAEWYSRIIKKPIKVVSSPFGGWSIGPQVQLLENIRFFQEEEHNDPVFAKELAGMADVFVNEAFAVAHRKHASTVGVARLLPSYAGIHFAKEIEEFSRIIDRPLQPLAVIIGGAKIETKLPMVESMHQIAEFVLVGGEIADHVKELITIQREKAPHARSIVLVADLTSNGRDITRKSAENFMQVINKAKTIVWNGPMGETGKNPLNEEGTRLLAQAVANSSAYTIVGGGDTVSYLKQHKLLDKFDFVSVGGGAMLEYLSGNELPAIQVLRAKE